MPADEALLRPPLDGPGNVLGFRIEKGDLAFTGLVVVLPGDSTPPVHAPIVAARLSPPMGGPGIVFGDGTGTGGFVELVALAVVCPLVLGHTLGAEMGDAAGKVLGVDPLSID